MAAEDDEIDCPENSSPAKGDHPDPGVKIEVIHDEDARNDERGDHEPFMEGAPSAADLVVPDKENRGAETVEEGVDSWKDIQVHAPKASSLARRTPPSETGTETGVTSNTSPLYYLQ